MAGVDVNRNWPVKVERLKSLTSSKVELSKGQILSGKVLKIFPNQQAEVMLAGKPINAKLLAPLSLGKNYWFQVESTDETTHLRVLIDQPITKQNHVDLLVKGLRFPVSESNKQLLSMLIEDNVVLEQSMLSKLVEFLSNKGKEKISNLTVMTMVKVGLPLTDSVYQAINQKNMTSLTNQLEHLFTQMSNNISEDLKATNFMERFQSFVKEPNAIESAVLPQILSPKRYNQEHVLELMKTANLLPASTSMNDWEGIRNEVIRYVTNQSRAAGQLGQSTESLSQQSAQMDMFKTKGLPFIVEQLRPLLSKKLPVQQEKILIELLAKYDRPVTDNWETTRNKFLIQLKHFLHFSGINHENQIAKTNENELLTGAPTLKSLILQVLDGNGDNERLGRLLQTINGIQLSSSNDLGLLSSVSFQIPGNRLGVSNDLHLNISGRKNDSNEINSDFCNILFYLELEHLGETTIEMRIQKRTVHLIIRNMDSSIESILVKYKPMLKNTLERLNYHLSSVKFETFDKAGKREVLSGNVETSVGQGVDYKV